MTDAAFNGAVRSIAAPDGLAVTDDELAVFGLAAERARNALAAALRRADRAEAELASLVERIGTVIAAAGAADRRRADAAEAEAARLRALLDGKAAGVAGA